MKETAKELRDFYQKKLERKQRLIKPLLDKRNNEGFEEMASNEFIEYKVLNTEINLITLFIDNLEDL